MRDGRLRYFMNNTTFSESFYRPYEGWKTNFKNFSSRTCRNVFIVPMRDGRLSSSFLSSSVNFPSFYRPYEGWKTKLITAWNLKIFISFYRPYEGWKFFYFEYDAPFSKWVFIVPMRDGRINCDKRVIDENAKFLSSLWGMEGVLFCVSLLK